MRLLEAVAATRLCTTAAGGLDRSIGLAILRSRIGTTLAGTALDRLAITISAILAVSTIASISPVTPIIVAVTIAEAVLVLVAPEGTIAIGVVTRMAVLLPALMLRLAVMLGHGRLRKAVVHHVVAAIVVAAEVVALARDTDVLAVAIGHVAALRLQLLAIGHDDAAVVLGVLQIILRQHRIAGGLRIASERQIFLGDVRRGTPDLHIRAVGFETARKWILALPIPVAATAAILLSLPHLPLRLPYY
jgi:hypothetical protein